MKDWVDPGHGNTAGYNPRPYRGRPTNSHKRGAGGGKPPKKSSGGATGAMLYIPIGIASGVMAVLAFVVGYLAHGYGLI